MKTTHSSLSILGLACLLTFACGKESPTSGEKGSLATGDTAAATKNSPPDAVSAPAKITPGSAPTPAPEATTYACNSDALWETQDLKALQTGTLQTLKKGITLPSLKWEACEGREGCEKISLAEGQTLLAIGQNGNDVSVLIEERCGDHAAVLVGPTQGPARVAIRGMDMDFEAGRLGGDRFLLSAIARHRSDKAKEGFVPREYFVTGREGAFSKLEPARNKSKGTPAFAASQFVMVNFDDGMCTTAFWKLGVDQCDFRGPGTQNFAAVGANLIFVENGKGMKWNAKDGASELMPAMDWVISDGMNVAWSSEGNLYMTQPRWDLPELKATPAKGAPGERPLALGCGRLLSREGDDFRLRNVNSGTAWNIDASRLPKEFGRNIALGCSEILFENGERATLDKLGMGNLIPMEAPPNPPENKAIAENTAATDKGEVPPKTSPSDSTD